MIRLVTARVHAKPYLIMMFGQGLAEHGRTNKRRKSFAGSAPKSRTHTEGDRRQDVRLIPLCLASGLARSWASDEAILDCNGHQLFLMSSLFGCLELRRSCPRSPILYLFLVVTALG